MSALLLMSIFERVEGEDVCFRRKVDCGVDCCSLMPGSALVGCVWNPAWPMEWSLLWNCDRRFGSVILNRKREQEHTRGR